MDDALEARIRADAITIATYDLGLDEHGVIDGFRWVAYPGSVNGLRVHVFPRPIDPGLFFDRVDTSILSLLDARPVKGVRSGPSAPGIAKPARAHASYLATPVLESIVRDAESLSRKEETGSSRMFFDAPKAGDLVSYSFSPDEIDAYVPRRGSRTLTSGVERFVRIDRFGSDPVGDVDIIAQPHNAPRDLLDHRGRSMQVTLSAYSKRRHLLSLVREGVLREYRMLLVPGLSRDPAWYVDAHDLLSSIRAYSRNAS